MGSRYQLYPKKFGKGINLMKKQNSSRQIETINDQSWRKLSAILAKDQYDQYLNLRLKGKRGV
jgi:hypothetical protein